jgi:hypothetical protein
MHADNTDDNKLSNHTTHDNSFSSATNSDLSCRVVRHPGAIMPSVEALSFWMLENVAACMAALVIHNPPHLVIDPPTYLVASTCRAAEVKHTYDISKYSTIY